MPAKPFSVHLNLDDLARSDLAALLQRPESTPSGGATSAGGSAAPAEIAHHGASGSRQAARERSGRDRSGRAAGAAGGRTYAFRRS
jgi:hypothetical protein